jgi:hypothetical protein
MLSQPRRWQFESFSLFLRVEVFMAVTVEVLFFHIQFTWLWPCFIPPYVTCSYIEALNSHPENMHLCLALFSVTTSNETASLKHYATCAESPATMRIHQDCRNGNDAVCLLKTYERKKYEPLLSKYLLNLNLFSHFHGKFLCLQHFTNLFQDWMYL